MIRAVAIVIACAVLAACEQAPAGRAATEPASQGSPPATRQGSDSAPSTSAPTSSGDSLRAVLGALVRGESSDSASWFSPATADVLRAVDVDDSGHAIVDFDDLRAVIPNASSSAGSEMLLRELNEAVFATPGITSVEYRMGGSCQEFGDWLQFGICIEFTRPQ